MGGPKQSTPPCVNLLPSVRWVLVLADGPCAIDLSSGDA